MSEEIGKILQMLEAGKINSEEAERLIRAINDSERPHEARRPPRPNPFRDIEDLFRLIGRAAQQACNRKRRWAVWRFYSFLRWQEEARRERARTMSVFQRVCFILRERALIDAPDLTPETRFRTEGLATAFSIEVLRVGLEYEFDLQIAAADLSGLETIQDLVSYVERRAAEEAAPAASPQAAQDSPPGKGSSSRAPRTKRGGQAPEPAG